MGEYAKLAGEEIKIGTCEDMLYLRYDQRHLVWPQYGNVNPMSAEAQKVIRFRFPWPDEDHVAPGGFDNPFKRLAVDVPAPDDFEHGIVQFVAQSQGYNVCLPCPEGPDAVTEFTIHRNGFPGRTFLTQQAVRDGLLVGIFQCVCGRAWRAPTLADATPAIEAILADADAYERRKDDSRANWLREVALRLTNGYNLKED